MRKKLNCYKRRYQVNYNYNCFNYYTLLIIELEEELREKTRENESLIESVETLQVKTGIIILVADFV